jgi:two-component system, OmpR family, KDP operon response regulator KdpE
MKSGRVLVVDDEPQIRRVLRATLGSEGYEIAEAHSGEEALEQVLSSPPDLILLDLNMPGLGGLAACRAIRAASDVPVIILSVRNTDADKVEALDAGADDYVTKPFSFDELAARIRAALRRRTIHSDQSPHAIKTEDLEIDFVTRRVLVHGTQRRLTPTEFDLLRQLVTQANRPVPHKKLLSAVWGPEHESEVEYLRVFVNQLRKKIEPNPLKPQYIITEPRIGYQFVIPDRVPAEA